MKKKSKKEIRAYGVRLLLSRHPEIRKLKRDHYPAYHGTKLWASSWLLMDYLKHQGLPRKAHLMEVGCGWGLAGIYCAKKHGAIVTGVDRDPGVFPFLQLHADINREKISTLEADLRKIKKKDLKQMDVVIGSDICFWDNLVDPLRKFIQRALRSGVKQVYVADPGRPTFEKTASFFCDRGTGEIIDWSTRKPRNISGKILQINPN